jgi:hypothetical protein
MRIKQWRDFFLRFFRQDGDARFQLGDLFARKRHRIGQALAFRFNRFRGDATARGTGWGFARVKRRTNRDARRNRNATQLRFPPTRGFT